MQHPQGGGGAGAGGSGHGQPPPSQNLSQQNLNQIVSSLFVRLSNHVLCFDHKEVTTKTRSMFDLDPDPLKSPQAQRFSSEGIILVNSICVNFVAFTPLCRASLVARLAQILEMDNVQLLQAVNSPLRLKCSTRLNSTSSKLHFQPHHCSIDRNIDSPHRDHGFEGEARIQAE